MLGVPVYAVLELLRPLPQPVGTAEVLGPAGRRRGGTGLLLGIGVGALLTVVLHWLASWSPLFAVGG